MPLPKRKKGASLVRKKTASSGPKLPWTSGQANTAIKTFSSDRTKYLKNLKGMGYYLLPELIVTKYKGELVAIEGVYVKGDTYKMGYAKINSKTNKPEAGWSGVITKAKYDKLSKSPGAIPPKRLKVTDIKKQTKKFEEWLQTTGEKLAGKVAADTKKGKEAPSDTSDLRKVSTYLKNNLKSIKGFYATWNKNNEMAIELPYKFKPTIAKFAQEGGFDYHIDFGKGEFSRNAEMAREGGPYPSEQLGQFKDIKQLLVMIKKQYRLDKQKAIADFEDSPRNTWHY